jgi:hypothetical protein
VLKNAKLKLNVENMSVRYLKLYSVDDYLDQYVNFTLISVEFHKLHQIETVHMYIALNDRL